MKLVNWIFILVGIAGLIGVRMVEDRLFYDPFLDYFRHASAKFRFPEFEWTPLILSHLLRFFLNLAFSTLIIQFAFRRKTWTIQGIVMILLVFLLTFPIYLFCISTKFEIGYLFSFYMRRFVIQPLVLLLIIPLFYYRARMAD